MFRCWEVIVLSKRKSESVTIFRINKAHRGIGGLEYFFLSSRSLIANYLVIVIFVDCREISGQYQFPGL